VAKKTMFFNTFLLKLLVIFCTIMLLRCGI